MAYLLSVVDFGLALTAPELAVTAERLGFHRYWMGEHHGPEQAGSPLLRTALVAGSTSRIRVGTAGVCLRYHSPLVIAEDAMLNAAMFPGRIDLGVCNGAGAMPAVLATLLDGRDGERTRGFADKATELHALLHRRLPADHPLFWHQARREYGEPPECWVLGTSMNAARLAAALGACFAFSEHHGADLDGPAIVACYRAAFEEHHGRAAPRVAVMISGFCTDDRSEAHRLAARSTGARTDGGVAPAMVGNPDDCAAYLYALTRRFGDMEIAVLDGFFRLPSATWDHAQRERMLELLAGIAGLAST